MTLPICICGLPYQHGAHVCAEPVAAGELEVLVFSMLRREAIKRLAERRRVFDLENEFDA